MVFVIVTTLVRLQISSNRSEIIRSRADRAPPLLHVHVKIDSHYYRMHTTTLIHLLMVKSRFLSQNVPVFGIEYLSRKYARYNIN